MHNPLDRLLGSARKDLAMLKRAVSPRKLEAIDRSRRQLAALIDDFQLLDREILATEGNRRGGADVLQRAYTRPLCAGGFRSEEKP